MSRMGVPGCIFRPCISTCRPAFLPSSACRSLHTVPYMSRSVHARHAVIDCSLMNGLSRLPTESLLENH